jgi:RsiW-degrading membrane proteinase PrsW (M82 family)
MMAAKLAIALEDISALRPIALDQEFLASCSSSMLLKMARLLDDKTLLLRGLWVMQRDRFAQPTGLLIALFSAVLWLVILTTSTGLRLRQALNYFPAVLAGMLSVWLLHTLQVLLQYDVDTHFDAELSAMHRIFNWVMYVGVPEEAVKISFFTPFLPFLLRLRSAGKAALTAGCVGLGFALNENLQYYQDYGVTIAISRLLTANIIHISLTGILGYELYLLIQSQFHRAVDFLLTFGAVTLAHGLYDFCNAETTIEGLELGSIIIVALSARRYLQYLHADHSNSNQPVSRTSIFCFGAALLVGALMVITVLETQSLTGITLVLKEAVGLATVALIYVREFREI